MSALVSGRWIERFVVWNALVWLGAATLMACSTLGAAPTVIPAALAAAQRDVQLALDFWGITKGVVLIAETSDPRLVPIATPVIARVDPIAAQAQAALADAPTDAATLEAFAAQIRAQAVQLQTVVAPAVTVVPNK